MSGMISRYQKKGGFVSLLKILESCGPKKQQQLLTAIEQEDSRWAQAIRAKLLTVDRVLKWHDEAIAEIIDKMNELTLATALYGPLKDHFERVIVFLPKLNKARIYTLRDDKSPTPEEIATATLKILEFAREAISSGKIKLEKIDPLLNIEDDIEVRIENNSLQTAAPASTVAAQAPITDIALVEENNKLRDENRRLREKVAAYQKWIEQRPL